MTREDLKPGMMLRLTKHAHGIRSTPNHTPKTLLCEQGELFMLLGVTETCLFALFPNSIGYLLQTQLLYDNLAMVDLEQDLD